MDLNFDFKSINGYVPFSDIWEFSFERIGFVHDPTFSMLNRLTKVFKKYSFEKCFPILAKYLIKSTFYEILNCDKISYEIYNYIAEA